MYAGWECVVCVCLCGGGEGAQTLVDGNKATASIQFISDGISLRIGAEKPLSYGDKISTALNASGEQGWYLITERDVCGNVEKYLIFVDVQQPELYASVTYGNRNKELINFNQTYIDENTETMRYIELDISSLTDNIDDFVMVSIEGTSYEGRITSGLTKKMNMNWKRGKKTVTAKIVGHNQSFYILRT